MKRFTFRLQAVLTLRLRAEQEALERYARALRIREDAADRLHQHETELCDTRRQWLNEMADGCPAIRAAQTLAYCHSLEDRRARVEHELQQAEIQLDRASQNMLAARQAREAIENLLHRQQADYDLRARLEDQKILDDLVGRRSPISLAGNLTPKPSLN